MKICNLIMILWGLTISTICYADDNVFFPDKINIELKTDLVGFLKRLPQNEGQREGVNEILSSPEYPQIVLFIDSPFSSEHINRASMLKSPFLLMEILDILSYNLNRKNFFSDWYMSKIVLLAQNQPKSYMRPFLLFCQKSDGAFAEDLADPLTKVIDLHPKEFSAFLKSINEAEKFCGILATGDYRIISMSMKRLARYNETRNNRFVNKLLGCLISSNESIHKIQETK